MNSKKQARRDRAAARFSIMPFNMWVMVNHLAKRAYDKAEEQTLYAAYVDRKTTEANALGL